LRQALTEEIQKRDPSGTNETLHQMVIIGHSQGGLLTKGTVVDTGDHLSRLFFTNKLEELKISEKERAALRRLIVWKPLPFVRRVVFIATPHRGSYLSGSFARRLAARFVALPRAMVTHSSDLIKLTAGSEGGSFFGNRVPTSLDGMSPKNPALLAMAELPVLPPVKAHSIIPVSKGDPEHNGRDGVVAYSSAHVDYVESELIVPSSHTCLDNPATIEEVRRILHEHLRGLKLNQ
jgi:pimeloyl-ACP methyl ester carboxylesterase